MIKCQICLKRWWFSTKVKCDCNKPKSMSQLSHGYYTTPVSSSSTQPISASNDQNRVIEHLILQSVVLDSSHSGNCHQVIHQEQASSGGHSHSSCDSSSSYSSSDSGYSGSSYDSGSSPSSSWD